MLWGGDDGIELDFSGQNTVAHHNLITNTANGISFQFVHDGPSYAYRNVIYNAERGPYKIKPEADWNDGVFIDDYRHYRPMVERAIAWIVSNGHRRVRYRGVEANRTQLALRVAAINLRRLVNLGLDHTGEGWAIT